MNEAKEANEVVANCANKSLAQRIRERRELVRVGKEAYDRVRSTRRALVKSILAQIDLTLDAQGTLQSVCRHYAEHQRELQRLLDIAREANQEHCTIAEAEDRVNARQAVLESVRSSNEDLLAWARAIGIEQLVAAIETQTENECIARATQLTALGGLGESQRLCQQLHVVRSYLEATEK